MTTHYPILKHYIKDVGSSASSSIRDTHHPTIIMSYPSHPCSKNHHIPSHPSNTPLCIPQAVEELAYRDQLVIHRISPTTHIYINKSYSLPQVHTMFYIVTLLEQPLTWISEYYLRSTQTYLFEILCWAQYQISSTTQQIFRNVSDLNNDNHIDFSFLLVLHYILNGDYLILGKMI